MLDWTSPKLPLLDALVLPPKLLLPPLLLPFGAPGKPLLVLPLLPLLVLLLLVLPLLDCPLELVVVKPLLPEVVCPEAMHTYDVSHGMHPPAGSVPLRVGFWMCGSVVAVSVPLPDRPMILPGPLVHAPRRRASAMPAWPSVRLSAMDKPPETSLAGLLLRSSRRPKYCG
jgi:hypothetical protein